MPEQWQDQFQTVIDKLAADLAASSALLVTATGQRVAASTETYAPAAALPQPARAEVLAGLKKSGAAVHTDAQAGTSTHARVVARRLLLLVIGARGAPPEAAPRVNAAAQRLEDLVDELQDQFLLLWGASAPFAEITEQDIDLLFAG